MNIVFCCEHFFHGEQYFSWCYSDSAGIKVPNVQDTVNRVWISGDGLEWSLVFRRVNWAGQGQGDLSGSLIQGINGEGDRGSRK